MNEIRNLLVVLVLVSGILAGGTTYMFSQANYYGTNTTGTVLDESNSSSALNDLIVNVRTEVQQATPDSSEWTAFAWSISTGVFNAARLLFDMGSVINDLITLITNDPSIQVPEWAQVTVSMVVDVFILITIMYFLKAGRG